MHTVVETPEYLAAAKRAGIPMRNGSRRSRPLRSLRKRATLSLGRKVRLAREGKGKSGGYRLITYYVDGDSPVILVTMISKGQTANLSDRQKLAVRAAAKAEKQVRRRE